MVSISPAVFRWVVAVVFLLNISLMGYWSAGGEWLLLSKSGADALQWNYYDATLSSDNLILWWTLREMACWFSYIGLFFFWSIGRWALLAAVASDILFAALSGVTVSVALESAIGYFVMMADVFFLTLSFFSPLATKFERQPDH